METAKGDKKIGSTLKRNWTDLPDKIAELPCVLEIILESRFQREIFDFSRKALKQHFSFTIIRLID